MRRLLLLSIVALCLPAALWAVLPVPSTAGPEDELDQLESKIGATRSKLERRRGRERVLTSEVSAQTARIRELQREIDTLTARQQRLEADLAAKRAELYDIQGDLRAERARLARLRARLKHARRTLALRLVELYKSDEPDAVTVILNADGFADLLERGEFLSRIGAQDARIIRAVREARAEAKATTERLARLERRQRTITERVLVQRDEVATIRDQVVAHRQRWAAARAEKAQVLAEVRASRQDLEGDLAWMEDRQAEIKARLAAATAPGISAPAGPVRSGSGGLIWPVNGPITSPFGSRWGRLHAGVDIGAGAGTPIRAAAGGTVVLLGPTAGYGNFICIQHGGGLQTCYAHLSSFATSQGAHVSQGQVIGAVGCTGHCFGDHLHFETRVGGSPQDPMGYL